MDLNRASRNQRWCMNWHIEPVEVDMWDESFESAHELEDWPVWSLTMTETIRVRDGREEWLFDGEIGLTEEQIRQLLSRIRPTLRETDLEHVAACCFEMFGKHVSIWRVPRLRVLSVATANRS